jgi:hypothetical protein
MNNETDNTVLESMYFRIQLLQIKTNENILYNKM